MQSFDVKQGYQNGILIKGMVLWLWGSSKPGRNDSGDGLILSAGHHFGGMHFHIGYCSKNLLSSQLWIDLLNWLFWSFQQVHTNPPQQNSGCEAGIDAWRCQGCKGRKQAWALTWKSAVDAHNKPPGKSKNCKGSQDDKDWHERTESLQDIH